MADVKVLNLLRRGVDIQLPGGGTKEKPLIKTVKIPAGESAVLDKDRFNAALKGNKALKSLVDQKRLVVGASSGTMTTPDAEELQKRTSDPVKPADLKETKDAKQGKVKHEVTSVETVEVDQADAPKGGKRKK